VSNAGRRILALLVEDVTLLTQHRITAHVRFRGEAAITLTLPCPLTAQQRRATHERYGVSDRDTRSSEKPDTT